MNTIGTPRAAVEAILACNGWTLSRLTRLDDRWQIEANTGEVCVEASVEVSKGLRGLLELAMEIIDA